MKIQHQHEVKRTVTFSVKCMTKMRVFVPNTASLRRVYTRKVMKRRRREKDSRINTRQNSRSAGPCATASQSRYCTYVVVRKRSANCENIIKCRTTELARVGEPRYFLVHNAFIRLT